MHAEHQEAETADVYIDVFRRASVPGVFEQRIGEVIAQLERLEDAGTIAEFQITRWNNTVTVATSERERRAGSGPLAIDAYEAFESWADERGVSLAPFFDVHTVGRSEVITLPILCLAVYEDDELEAVVPCSDHESVYNVHEYLDALEADDPPRF